MLCGGRHNTAALSASLATRYHAPRMSSPGQTPLHGLAPEIISMIHGEIEAALVSLKGMRSTDDAQRIAAVVVMLEEVLPEFTGQGHKPWRAIPWLDCASHLLQLVGTTK